MISSFIVEEEEEFDDTIFETRSADRHKTNGECTNDFAPAKLAFSEEGFPSCLNENQININDTHGASNIPTTPTYDENVNDTFVVDIGDGCDGDQQLGASNDKPPDEDEDDDDGIAEFQATVLKRGSVAADRKRSKASQRGRNQRKRSSGLTNQSNISSFKTTSNIVSPLTRLATNVKLQMSKKTIAQNPEHQRSLELAFDRMKIGVPHSLELEFRDEAFSIVQDMAQAYKKLLGKSHHLTIEANDYLNSW